MSKPIPKEKVNPQFEWEPTTICLNILSSSDPDSRQRSLDILSSRRIFWIRVKEHRVDAVIKSEEEDYLCRLDFEDNTYGDFTGGIMDCDCPAFRYRNGPCKHLLAVCLDSLARTNNEEFGYEDWMRIALAEVRNAGEQYRLWEEKPDPVPEIASQYGARVGVVEARRREIKCYIFNVDGREYGWTGVLPIPREGDEVTVKLSTGDEVEADVLSTYRGDIEGFLGLWVKLKEAPDEFTQDTIVVYGSEVLR